MKWSCNSTSSSGRAQPISPKRRLAAAGSSSSLDRRSRRSPGPMSWLLPISRHTNFSADLMGEHDGSYPCLTSNRPKIEHMRLRGRQASRCITKSNTNSGGESSRFWRSPPHGLRMRSSGYSCSGASGTAGQGLSNAHANAERYPALGYEPFLPLTVCSWNTNLHCSGTQTAADREVSDPAGEA